MHSLKNISVNHKHKAYDVPKYKWKFLFIILIPLAFFIKWLMSLSPEITEKYYSQSIYKYIMQPISQFTGLVPFSVAEIVIILLAIYIPLRTIYAIIKAIRNKKPAFFLSFIANILLVCSVYFFLQTIFWTINYERLSFADNAGIKIQASSVDELESLCNILIDNTNTLRQQVALDENGVMTITGGFKSIKERSETAFQNLQKTFPFLDGKYGLPKPVLLSRLMSHTNIIGIYTCITGEANIDTDIPDIGLISTTLHEMVHQRGFAREDEANYISYIACMSHPDPDFKYSGSSMALTYSMNALYSVDKDRYFKLIQRYSEGYLKDLQNEQEYWKQYQGITKQLADRMNDTYLKLNGEADGVKSYGRMVDLLLAQYRTGNK